MHQLIKKEDKKMKRNLKMKPHLLEGRIGLLSMNNWGGLVIKIDDSCESLKYQWQYGNKTPDTIYNAEIDYFEDTENVTGYADEEEGLYQAGFVMENGDTYFLGEFMRVDAR
jgi:hypothetical protein